MPRFESCRLEPCGCLLKAGPTHDGYTRVKMLKPCAAFKKTLASSPCMMSSAGRLWMANAYWYRLSSLCWVRHDEFVSILEASFA